MCKNSDGSHSITITPADMPDRNGPLLVERSIYCG